MVMQLETETCPHCGRTDMPVDDCESDDCPSHDEYPDHDPECDIRQTVAGSCNCGAL